MEAIAAAVWLIVAPVASWFLAFKLRFVLGTAGFVLVAIVLPVAVAALAGLVLGWRLRALALALAALLVASALAVVTLAFIAHGM
jgi:hypothetical protein